VDWSALSKVRLPVLRPATSAQLCAGDDLDELSFDGLTIENLRADDAHLLECRFTRCELTAARLRRSTFSACVLEEVGATALDIADSTVRDVVVRSSRFGALTAHGASLLRLSVEGGRLDYVNLRGARLTQVQFLDCRIADLDVGSARLQHVRFRDCRIDRLSLSGATLEGVDLAGAELGVVDGVDRLAGSTINLLQLSQLAPALAATMGITVSPD